MIDPVSNQIECQNCSRNVIPVFLSDDKTPLFILYYLQLKGTRGIHVLTEELGLVHKEKAESYLDILRAKGWVLTYENTISISEEGRKVLAELKLMPDSEAFLLEHSELENIAFDSWIKRIPKSNMLEYALKQFPRQYILRRCLISLLNTKGDYALDAEIIRKWQRSASPFFPKLTDRELIALYDTIIALENDSEFLHILKGGSGEYYQCFKRKIGLVKLNRAQFKGYAKLSKMELRNQKKVDHHSRANLDSMSQFC